MKLFKRSRSSRKLEADEPARAEPSTAMESFLLGFQQENAITTISIVTDGAPMLPASFAQSVSYDPECSCDFDAKLAEQRWQTYFRKRHAEKAANASPPRRKGSMDFDSGKFSVPGVQEAVLMSSRCVEC